MTEERIIELAEEWNKKILRMRWVDGEPLATLIRTVAAEARKEGIEEMHQAAFEESLRLSLEEWKFTTHESALKRRAQRLKEEKP